MKRIMQHENTRTSLNPSLTKLVYYLVFPGSLESVSTSVYRRVIQRRPTVIAIM